VVSFLGIRDSRRPNNLAFERESRVWRATKKKERRGPTLHGAWHIYTPSEARGWRLGALAVGPDDLIS
jgi:hypothetical protein